jgi:hypothetical protein
VLPRVLPDKPVADLKRLDFNISYCFFDDPSRI